MENELIQFVDVDNEKRMSSLEIAKITGKQHKNVMQAIRNMEESWRKVSGLKFKLASYIDAQGKSRPCYELTKTECLYIATKFNDEARARLVLRWEQLETEKQSSITVLPNFSNPAEAARAWAEQYEQRQIAAERADAAEKQVLSLVSEIETMQPKVTYYDMILNNKSTILTTQIALDYGMSAKAFNQKLYDLKIQHKVGDQWILYAPYLAQGYTHSKPVEITKHDGQKIIKYNSEWTQKGRLFLYDELKKVGVIPMIER